MFDYDLNKDFITINSESTTSSAVYRWVSEPVSRAHQKIEDLQRKLSIDLIPSEGLILEQTLPSNASGLEKKSNDRLALLARAYGQKQAPQDQRELLARIQMIESEIEVTVPRYTKDDWELLEQFNQSIEKLTEGI